MKSFVTVSDAFEQFLAEPSRKLITRNKYRYKLRPFLEENGALAVSGVSAEVINSWFAQMEQTYADATLAMARSCLITFFNFCLKRGWLEGNPAQQLPRYDDRPAHVVTANEEHLASALTFCGIMSKSSNPYHRRDAAVFALAAISGARRSNIMLLSFRETVTALGRPDFDERVGNIYTVASKGKTAIEIVFGEWHATILRDWLAVRPSCECNRLFVHLRSSSVGRPLEANGLGKARRNVCQVAGVPPISFQEMRRLRGTKIARQFGLELAAEALGHISGTRVIKEHYYDPDRNAARVAILETGKS